ncbi:MAG: DUF1501 domain-containing protein [Candidatus Hydrogenedentes bacterium]|nr:DUF1501 domain-containing protein [Candidatus Hydrogenedentota bacterium]
MSFSITRRSFLKSAALFSSMGLAPAFLTRTAEGQAPAIEGFNDGRVLVVLQLGGGNDGLNTVVPYTNDDYYRARPQLGIKKDQALRLTDDLGLNMNLEGFKSLYDDGKAAVIQGVGYPNPDRSHFRSMEIWHTASDSDRYLGTGWIGRYFDNCCSGSARPQVGVALGSERPQAFDGDKGLGVAFDNPENFGWRPGKFTDTSENFAQLNRHPAPAGSTLDFLRHTTSNAIMSSAEVKEAADRAGLDNQAVGRKNGEAAFRTVAGLIRGGLQTRIYYVAAGGFDTHANQLGTHDNLLKRVGDGLRSFQQQLEEDGTADRVLTMVFSEFGRRVEQNASGGTDHGTAAPMFLVGNAVKAGVHGATPSLADLDDGDLKHTVDFRNVYAGVLKHWLGVDPQPVLGQPFDAMQVV